MQAKSFSSWRSACSSAPALGALAGLFACDPGPSGSAAHESDPARSAAQVEAPADSARVLLPVLAPGITAEMGMDAPVIVQAAGQQDEPAIAYSGDQYLVVWADERESTEPLLMGTRVGLDGTVLDPYGIRIGEGARPSVASDGHDFLVTYDRDSDVFAVRIDPDGRLVADEFVVVDADKDQTTPDVAFDGANYVIVWEDTRHIPADDYTNSRDIYRARVSPEGAVLDPDGVLTAAHSGPGGGLRPAIASDGDGSLVVWEDQRILGVRLAPNGAQLDDVPFFVSPPLAGAPDEAEEDGPQDLGADVAFVGDAYVVAWAHSEEGSSSARQVVAARVDPHDGAVLDPEGIVITHTDDVALYLDDVVVGSDGRDAVVLFSSGESDVGRASYRVRVDVPQAQVLDAEPVELAPITYGHALAVAPGSSLAVYVDDSTEDEAVMNTWVAATRLAPDGAALDDPGLLLSASANAQITPTCSFDGEHFLVAWADDRDYDPEDFLDIWGARVSPAGAVLDPAAIPIRRAASWNFSPRAVFDGTNHVVTAWAVPNLPFDGDPSWSPELVRVSPEGQVDATPLVLEVESYEEAAIAAASNGSGMLLAVDSYDGVDVAHVAAGDHPAATITTPVSVPEHWYGLDPSLSYGGGGYLMTWYDDQGPRGLVASRLDPAGKLMDPSWLQISAPTAKVGRAAIASSESMHLVVWPEPRGAEEPGSLLRAARVDANGTVLDPGGFVLEAEIAKLPIEWSCAAYSPTDEYGPCPAAAYDGEAFAVVWRAPPDAAGDVAPDLFGARIGADGAILDKFVVSSEPAAEGPPALVAGKKGQTLVAYERFIAAPPFAAKRVRARLIEL